MWRFKRHIQSMTAKHSNAQESSSTFPVLLLLPKYWLLWLLYALLKLLVTLLPYNILISMGKGLGNLSYLTMRRRRRIAEVNIRLCFPEMSPQQHAKLVQDTFKSAGASVFEILMSWWLATDKLSHLCHVEGLEHLQKANAAGKGVILLTGHMSCLEMGSRMLLFHCSYAFMYKRHRNDFIEYVMRKARVKYCPHALRHDDIRGMLKVLKQNKAVWYAPDQDLGINRSVFAPFMGVQTATIVAPSRFAKMTGAKVVPYFPIRLPDGKGYKLTILPALENFPSGDEVENATRINAVIAEHIRKAPDQYIWLHRRFKSRPEGEASVYD